MFLLSGDGIFYTIQGEGVSIGKPAIFMRLHMCNLHCSWCFSGNTLIQTPKKKIKIKDITKGDQVLSFDGRSVVVDEVINIFKRKVIKNELLFIKLNKSNEDKIFVTKEHKFYVKGEWKKATDLVVGDEIASNEYGLWRMVNSNPMQVKEIALKVSEKQKGKNSYIRTESHRLIQRSLKLGFKNPRYVDGKRPGYLILWKKTRGEALGRDNYTCQNCGSKERLEVHHIKPYRISKDNSLSNLITLCKPCHLMADNQIIFHNGIDILDIKEVNDKQMARLDGNKEWCYVYNIETKNHNYFAYNLLAHNCDTKYTWDKSLKEYQTEPKRADFRDIIIELDKYKCNRLVITGGEPLLHMGAIEKFIDFVRDYDIEIETNGTIYPSEKLIKYGVQFNCSPKLENSSNEKALRYKPEVLRVINALKKSTFKFVVTSKADLEEIETIIRNCKLNPKKIIIMPEGISQEDIKNHALEVVDLCKSKGWRLLPRLQVMLWGHQRAI